MSYSGTKGEGSGSAGKSSMSLPLQVLARFPNPVFIETGTGSGQGVELAYWAGFRDIITIDVREASLSEARLRCPTCWTVLGDSRTMLRTVLEKITEPVTFWLDAHNLYGGQAPITCVMEEIAAISDWWQPGSVVLIDDWDWFGGGSQEGSPWKHCVSQSQLMLAVRRLAIKTGGRIHFEDQGASGQRQDIVVMQ